MLNFLFFKIIRKLSLLARFQVHGRTDFDVTTGRLQNQRYFQAVYCMYYNTTNCVKTMVCAAVILLYMLKRRSAVLQ